MVVRFFEDLHLFGSSSPARHRSPSNIVTTNGLELLHQTDSRLTRQSFHHVWGVLILRLLVHDYH